MTTTTTTPDLQAADLSTRDMLLNIGPAHPAMHGIGRLVTKLAGEVIEEADVEIGECIAWAALAEDVRVIVAYAEGARDRAALLHGLALARARGKPVIFMKVGRSA